MWDGYTGVHFDVILDVVPSKGHRLVLQTFPGGIHSGTDFYMNDAGIVIGETTVGQTPVDPRARPQRNRIRKAAQYATSIDEVARILREKNNGLYTNDWTIADVKTNEGAILLLGTNESKLWRTTTTPRRSARPGFLWANNNTRDPERAARVRRPARRRPVRPGLQPLEPRRRLLEVLRRGQGADRRRSTTVNLLASSPINRPHACDGKITTAEMAEKLVFIAHYGKVTLREKFPGREPPHARPAGRHPAPHARLRHLQPGLHRASS